MIKREVHWTAHIIRNTRKNKRNQTHRRRHTRRKQISTNTATIEHKEKTIEMQARRERIKTMARRTKKNMQKKMGTTSVEKCEAGKKTKKKRKEKQ